MRKTLQNDAYIFLYGYKCEYIWSALTLIMSFMQTNVAMCFNGVNVYSEIFIHVSKI